MLNTHHRIVCALTNTSVPFTILAPTLQVNFSYPATNQGSTQFQLSIFHNRAKAGDIIAPSTPPMTSPTLAHSFSPTVQCLVFNRLKQYESILLN